MRKKILITGATGNTGIEVVRYLMASNTQHKIVAGVRDIIKGKEKLNQFNHIEYVKFDFNAPSTFNHALSGINSLFLLRPPQLADVNKYIKPLLNEAKNKGVKEIIFLSVQGAEKSKVIPHNKIESLIKKTGFDYVFLRPGYFMQNLTTTLYDDIINKNKIVLPAGRAKFNWIDVKNIGEVAAIVLENFDQHKNKIYVLTGTENENFYTVVKLINKYKNKNIRYQSVNPIKFYRIKKKDGMKKGMILVMLMLHFLPRFQQEPSISDLVEKLTGKKPVNLKEFIYRESI